MSTLPSSTPDSLPSGMKLRNDKVTSVDHHLDDDSVSVSASTTASAPITNESIQAMFQQYMTEFSNKMTNDLNALEKKLSDKIDTSKDTLQINLDKLNDTVQSQ